MIPGVELSTDTTGGRSPCAGIIYRLYQQEFKSRLSGCGTSRAKQNEKMVAKLKNLAAMYRTDKGSGKSPEAALSVRAHVAPGFAGKGYNRFFQRSLFSNYRAGLSAYVAREKLTPPKLFNSSLSHVAGYWHILLPTVNPERLSGN